MPERQTVTAALPRISVVIPTFERAGRVGDAVQSVLEQDVPDLEVVVVDDGSTDGTLDVLGRRFGTDPRVKVAHQPNAGTAAARNLGLSLASGELIALLDSDDLLLPGNLRAQATRLLASPEAAMSVCDARFEGDWPSGQATLFGRLPRGLPRSVADVCRGGWLLVDCLLFRAPVIRALRFDPAWYVEDTELLYRFLAAGHTYVVEPRVLALYRRHDDEAGGAQKSRRKLRMDVEGIRLADAYLDRSGIASEERARMRRGWARWLTAQGLHAEARPHLWAWWRRRPWEVKVAWMLLRSAWARPVDLDALPAAARVGPRASATTS